MDEQGTEMRLPRGTESNLPALHSSRGALAPFGYRENVLYFEDSVDFRDYIDVLVRRKVFIGAVLLVVFVTTLLVTLVMTPQYKATGRLEFNLQTPKITKFDEMVMPQSQTREFMNTQTRLLTSDSLAWRVIETLRLDTNPRFNPDLEGDGGARGALRRLLGQDASSGTPGSPEAKQRLLQIFQDSLEIKAEKDTTVATLAFTSSDPALARDGVNTMLRSFISWQMDKKIGAAGLANEQLEKQIEVARQRLEQSEEDLNRFAKEAGIVSLDGRLNLVYRQLEEINSALAQAQAVSLNKEALLKQAHEASASELTPVVENRLIQDLREQHVDLASQYKDMLTVFRPDYPDAKRLKAKMDDVWRMIQLEERRIVQGMQNDFLAAKKNETILLKQAEESKARALELNDRATQYKILEREVESNKDIHQSLLQRAKEIDATAGSDISNIQIVDNAILPTVPYSPKVRLNLLLAIAGGLLLGVGGAFVLEHFDNTIKNIDEISDRFGIPILGVLPEADDEHLDQLDRLVSANPQASFAEAVRTTRVAIQLSSADKGDTRSLLLTSTCESEGKSTIAANMAQAFAMAGCKTLLIDADLRRPRLHNVFGVGNSGGLSELLTGSKSLKDVLRSTDMPNLHFIPAGILPPNPAELLASTKLRQYLSKLGKVFDRVIIDGPPAVGFADVLVLSNLVGGVILVSSMGRTHRQALRLFCRSLSNINARLLGSVVNRVDMLTRYGASYKYTKYYHHPYAYGDGRRSLPRKAKAIAHAQEPLPFEFPQ